MNLVVGIDPSLTSTGLAAITSTGVWASDRVESAGKTADTIVVRNRRAADIVASVMAFALGGPRPDLIVIEAPAFSRVQGSAHDRSGLWWRIVRALLAESIPVADVAPSARAKYATGVGGGAGGSKDKVLAAVIKRYPTANVDGNDVADATVLAAMGARHLGWPIETDLPAANLDSMVKVKWPAVLRPQGVSV